MANNELNTEDKILQAANSIFLLFGYHGTTIRQIATKEDVNKAAIHYYFRSKKKLYLKVVENICFCLSIHSESRKQRES